MTGRELLYSLLTANRKINAKLDLLDELRALAIGITASTDKESIQTSGDKDRIGNIVAKIADLENEINDRTDNYVMKKDFAKKIILEIKNEKHQNILYDYFICRITLSEIAEVYGMKYDVCRAEKSKALKTFDKLFNTRYRIDFLSQIQNIEKKY